MDLSYHVSNDLQVEVAASVSIWIISVAKGSGKVRNGREMRK